MADVFRCRLDWSGAAKGPTRDPVSFSRDLDVTAGSVALPMSAAGKVLKNVLRGEARG